MPQKILITSSLDCVFSLQQTGQVLVEEMSDGLFSLFFPNVPLIKENDFLSSRPLTRSLAPRLQEV